MPATYSRKSYSSSKLFRSGLQKIILLARNGGKLERRESVGRAGRDVCLPPETNHPTASCLYCEKIDFLWSHRMAKAHKQGYDVIFFIKSDRRQSRTLLRGGRSRHQLGVKKSEVGWLHSSLGAKTSGEQALLMMAAFQLKKKKQKKNL